MVAPRCALLVLLTVATLGPMGAARAEAPSGQMTLAHGISIVPRWFDPAESEGLVTPFIFYYALHAGTSSPSSGIRSHRGRIDGCGSPRTSPSTGRR